jgi:hypothetical protein
MKVFRSEDRHLALAAAVAIALSISAARHGAEHR